MAIDGTSPLSGDGGTAPLPVGKRTKKTANKKKAKKTAQVAAKEGKSKGPRGRKKEKGQISVRIHQEILDMAYAYAEAHQVRVVDLLEQGLFLALQERIREPFETTQARFLLQQCSADLLRLTVMFWGFLRQQRSELLEKHGYLYAKEQEHVEGLFRFFLADAAWREELLQTFRGSSPSEA